MKRKETFNEKVARRALKGKTVPERGTARKLRRSARKSDAQPGTYVGDAS